MSHRVHFGPSPRQLLVSALALLAVWASSPAAEPCDAPIAPVELRYRLLDDGRDRGHATVSLTPAEGGWEYRLESRSRFGFIPVSMQESTRFEWHDNRPRPKAYLRSSKGGPFQRRSTAHFDWTAGQSRGRHKGEDWSMPLDGDELDRLSVQLATAVALAEGKTTLTFDYIDRGRARSMITRPQPSGRLSTPAGQFEVVRVERDRGDRTTRLYHAPALDYLPIRVDHIDEDDSYTLVLESWRRLTCQSPGSAND